MASKMGKGGAGCKAVEGAPRTVTPTSLRNVLQTGIGVLRHGSNGFGSGHVYQPFSATEFAWYLKLTARQAWAALDKLADDGLVRWLSTGDGYDEQWQVTSTGFYVVATSTRSHNRLQSKAARTVAGRLNALSGLHTEFDEIEQVLGWGPWMDGREQSPVLVGLKVQDWSAIAADRRLAMMVRVLETLALENHMPSRQHPDVAILGFSAGDGVPWRLRRHLVLDRRSSTQVAGKEGAAAGGPLIELEVDALDADESRYRAGLEEMAVQLGMWNRDERRQGRGVKHFNWWELDWRMGVVPGQTREEALRQGRAKASIGHEMAAVRLARRVDRASPARCSTRLRAWLLLCAPACRRVWTLRTAGDGTGHVGHAATIGRGELATLTADDNKHGATPVSVSLLTYGMKDLQDSMPAVKGAAADRAAKLLAELGPEAWTAGRTESGVGALDLYVTPAGLKLLANSFSAGKPWYARLPGGVDGRHEEIAKLIETQGWADVVVTLASDDHDFDLHKDGSATVRMNAKSSAEAHKRANALLGTLSDTELTGGRGALVAAAARAPAAGSASFSSQLTMRVNAHGLLKLVDSDHVRDVRPVGFKDKLGTAFDKAAFEIATKTGYAEVVITVRSPFDSKVNTDAAFKSNVEANRRNADAVLADFGLTGKLHELPEFSAVLAHVSLQELNALKASGDGRIVSVEANKPVAKATLSTSAVSMNMATAWNVPAYRGTGQHVAVLDSGVQANHLMLSGKISREHCVGSNGSDGTTTWQSNCFNAAGARIAESDGAGTGPRCRGVRQTRRAHRPRNAGTARTWHRSSAASRSPCRGTATCKASHRAPTSSRCRCSRTTQRARLNRWPSSATC